MLVLLVFYVLIVLAFGAVGLFAGKPARCTSPGVVFLFMSSMAIPRNLMDGRLISLGRDRQSRSRA